MNPKLLLLAVMMPIGAKAQEGSGYPYLAQSSCVLTSKIPKNSGGILFNKDCSVGYVFPEKIGSARIMPRPSGALRLCDQFQSMLEEYSGYLDIVKSLQSKLKNARPDEIQDLVKYIAEVKALQTESKAQLDNIEAMRINVIFENSIARTVAEAQRINRLSVQSGIVFKQVPITEGKLEYIVEDPSQSSARMLKSVLSTSIPGNRRKISDNQAEVDFNGAIQGEMALTLSGACPFVEKVERSGKKYLTINDSKLNQTISANYTYAVPVISSAGYEAKIDGKKAIDLMQNEYGVNRQFSKEQWVQSLIENQVSHVLTINIWQLENNQLQDIIVNDVAERLGQKVLDFVEQNKVISREIPKLNVPESGRIAETRTKRECRAKKFLWFDTGIDCFDVPYSVEVSVDGTGTLWSSIKESIQAEFSEKVTMNQIIYRTNTATFELKAKEPVLMEVE